MSARMRNIPFYILALIIGFLLLYLSKAVNDDIVKVLLYPHARATEIFYNISLTYISGAGYSSPDGTFSIGRECMGSKFVIIIFAMNACIFVRYFKGIRKAAWMLLCLFGAFLAGAFVSCIRIIGSVPFVSHQKFTLIHSSMGITIYLFALAASYVLIKKRLGAEHDEEAY